MGVIPEYLRLEQELRKSIVDGNLQSGERLPDENTLAGRLNTSRPTLRKALDILASEGFLIRIPGKGTFVIPPEERNTLSPSNNCRYFRKMNKGIGVLVPSIHLYLGAGIVCGVEQTSRKRGYHVLLGNYEGEPDKEKECMDMFLNRGVSGLVSFAGFTSDAKLYLDIIKKGYPPIVFAGSGIEGADTDLVKTDNIVGVGEAVEDLIAQGYRNIGFASIGLQSIAARERFIGYREALHKAGLDFSTKMVFTQKSAFPEHRENIEQAKRVLTNAGIDALFVANEYSFIPFIRAIEEMNDKEFARLKIVCMDKPEFFDFSGYNISFLYQPAFKIGVVAADLLMDRIEKKIGDENVPKKILLPVEKELPGKYKEIPLHYAFAM